MQSIAEWCEREGVVSFFDRGRARHVPCGSPAGQDVLAELRDSEGTARRCQAPLCGKAFRSSRSDAQFCSPPCRQRAHRRRAS